MTSDVELPKPILQEIFNKFFESFEIITQDPNYRYVKTLSDNKVQIVLNCLIQVLNEKFEKKGKYTIPSVDFFVTKSKLGFDSVKDYDGELEPFTLTHFDVVYESDNCRF